MRRWTAARAGAPIVVGLIFGLAGCSSSPSSSLRPSPPATHTSATPAGTTVTTAPATTAPTTASSEAGAGVEAPDSAIPWSRVGAGWQVALWAPSAATAPGAGSPDSSQQRTTLYLVDPVGGRYLVTTLPAPSAYGLISWSGDGHRVLLSEPASGGGPTVEEIDLASGRMLHAVPTTPESTTPYTRPSGQALLVWTYGIDQAPNTLVRTAWSGSTQVRYPDSYPGLGTLSGGVLPGLDGMQLVVGTTGGLALTANDGTFVRAIGPIGRTCTPERWWDAGALLATCQPPPGSGTSVQALWIVPVSGQPATQLTNPQSPDNGDTGAWQVGGSTYVEALGACGTRYLANRGPNGTTAKVTVPGATDNLDVIGAYRSRLSIQARIACGSGESLFWFDPSTSAETPLLGPPVNGGGVLAALPYPGLQS